ncbi:MAG: ATP-dependent sacrificial sulfur transferase LarE [Candidatus Dormibacteria bacterium]
MTGSAALQAQRAVDLIRPLGRILVAYSGGVDSTLVLELANRALGAATEGVIADSPSLPRQELDAALDLAHARGYRVRVIRTEEVSLPEYRANDVDRCYHCKAELYGRLCDEAARIRAAVLDGFNRDDRSDWRPGRRAAVERGVRSPLDEVGLGKEEVRALAHSMGLPNWNKPQAACLSSRIPYGIPVTLESLSRVEAAEQVLRQEGFSLLRVRDRAGSASIEVEPGLVHLLNEPALRRRVGRRLKQLGFSEVAVDPHGYRPGHLNRAD